MQHGSAVVWLEKKTAHSQLLCGSQQIKATKTHEIMSPVWHLLLES